jgi:hypothetical protein
MIVSGANGTNYNNGTPNSFVQKIYVLNDKPSGLVLINTISLTGTSQSTNIIQVFTSPQLTKFGYSYVPSGSNATSQIFPKSVDYTNNKVIDLLFSDPTHVYQTFLGTQSY